jgi:hypothetical protein
MMTTLLALEPRVAGTDTLDPAAEFAEEFDESVGDLHDAAVCFLTSLPSACCVYED